MQTSLQRLAAVVVAIKCRVTPAETEDSATVFAVQEGLGALLTRVLIETVIDCR